MFGFIVLLLAIFVLWAYLRYGANIGFPAIGAPTCQAPTYSRAHCVAAPVGKLRRPVTSDHIYSNLYGATIAMARPVKNAASDLLPRPE